MTAATTDTMNRVRRRLIIITAAISLLAFAAGAAVAWALTLADPGDRE